MRRRACAHRLRPRSACPSRSPRHDRAEWLADERLVRAHRGV